MPEEKWSDSLPVDWILMTEVQKDGSKTKCYRNEKTDQTFYTKEDVYRYVDYAKNGLTKPRGGLEEEELRELLSKKGSKRKSFGASSSLPTTAPDTPLKDQPHEIEKHRDKNAKPRSKKFKNEKKGRGLK
ncbi:hypothetical protein L1049_018164 [Liquidambar formosana]|uniref:Uncharacterized protein n=1 Tax=Liquidambar formosana TaxID=63359 RepID=A0AAP0NIC5_LIQFO